MRWDLLARDALGTTPCISVPHALKYVFFLAHRKQNSESFASHSNSSFLFSFTSFPWRMASKVLDGLEQMLLVGSSLDKLVDVVSSSMGG